MLFIWSFNFSCNSKEDDEQIDGLVFVFRKQILNEDLNACIIVSHGRGAAETKREIRSSAIGQKEKNKCRKNQPFHFIGAAKTSSKIDRQIHICHHSSVDRIEFFPSSSSSPCLSAATFP